MKAKYRMSSEAKGCDKVITKYSLLMRSISVKPSNQKGA